jgi:hypothetical protein
MMMNCWTRPLHWPRTDGLPFNNPLLIPNTKEGLRHLPPLQRETPSLSLLIPLLDLILTAVTGIYQQILKCVKVSILVLYEGKIGKEFSHESIDFLANLVSLALGLTHVWVDASSSF